MIFIQISSTIFRDVSQQRARRQGGSSVIEKRTECRLCGKEKQQKLHDSKGAIDLHVVNWHCGRRCTTFRCTNPRDKARRPCATVLGPCPGRCNPPTGDDSHGFRASSTRSTRTTTSQRHGGSAPWRRGSTECRHGAWRGVKRGTREQEKALPKFGHLHTSLARNMAMRGSCGAVVLSPRLIMIPRHQNNIARALAILQIGSYRHGDNI